MAQLWNRGSQRRPNYWGRWWVNGRRVQLPLRSPQGGKPRDRETAKACLKAMDAALLAGGLSDYLPAKGPGMTVSELVERFRAAPPGPRVRNPLVYARDTAGLLRHVTDALGSKPAESVSDADFTRLKDALTAQSKSGQTIRNVLTRASRMFKWAMQGSGRILRRKDNPVSAVEKPRGHPVGEPLTPEAFLTRAECAALLKWARANQPAEHSLYASAIYTGMRQGELFRLTWTDVNLEARQIMVRVSKTGRRRVVPIPPELGAILRAWRKQPWHADTSLVFGSPDGQPRVQKTVWVAFQVALRGAGLRPMPFHSLRHSAASALVAAGVDLLTVARILGHSTMQMTMRYSHLAPDALSAAAERLTLKSPRRPKSGT